MLGNSIALIAVAALFGIEAWKANGGFARLMLTALAVLFALSGILLQFLASAIPKAGEIVADTFAQPVAWFVLFIAIFLVMRPFWATKRKTVKASGFAGQYELYQSAKYWVDRVRYDRSLDWWQMEDRENLLDLVNDGISLLLTFKTAGIAAPEFTTNKAEGICVGLETYFSALMPFMRDGHVAQVNAMAETTAERAVQVANAFDAKKWYLKNG